jgi:hypothetical protein
MEGGLDRKGETVLLEGFIHGAIDIGVLVSLGAVDEGGCRGMGPNVIADLDFGYASLERVGGIGKVGLVPFAVRCIFVGEVGIVEEFRFGPGVFLIANACLDGPLRFHVLIEQPVLDLGEHLMGFLIDDAFGKSEFELRVGKEPILKSVLRFWVGKSGKAAEVPPVG